MSYASRWLSGLPAPRDMSHRRSAPTSARFAKPRAVAPGQRWRFMQQESTVTRVLPGGGGNLGIAEFADNIPTAHVSTMLTFPAWSYVASAEVSAPCRCVVVGEGVVLSDGCAVHGGGAAIVMQTEPSPDSSPSPPSFRARSHLFLNRPKEAALCP